MISFSRCHLHLSRKNSNPSSWCKDVYFSLISGLWSELFYKSYFWFSLKSERNVFCFCLLLFLVHISKHSFSFFFPLIWSFWNICKFCTIHSIDIILIRLSINNKCSFFLKASSYSYQIRLWQLLLHYGYRFNIISLEITSAWDL